MTARKPATEWHVDAQIAMEVAAHEAVIRQAYKDSVGVWTWSVGLTGATGHDVTRYIGKPATMQKCMDIYVWALENYADAVRRAFGNTLLTKEEFAGALSFHWNTGAIGKASWVKHFKAGNKTQARANIMLYNKPAAIIGRRTKERDLIFSGKWSGKGRMTEYTRLTSRHTPVWASAVSVDVSKELQKAFGTTVAPDRAPQPNAPVNQPTLSPNLDKAPKQSLWAALAQILSNIFKRN